MPFSWKEHTKKFKWQTDDISGLPVTTIERIGAGAYVMACNLCGCSHNLLANEPTTGIYAPACSNGQYTSLWAIHRAAWIRQHPEAANHRTIMLRAVAAVETEAPHQEATDTAPELELVKPTRQRRKKAA